MYTHNLQTGVVTRDSDGVQVAPADYPLNHDALVYQEWLGAGAMPTPYVAAVVVDPLQLESDVVAAVQIELDRQAQTKNYDSILSAVTYWDSAIPQFASDGVAFKTWRDACWAYCYTILGQAQAGAIALPTVDEVIAGLPKLAL